MNKNMINSNDDYKDVFFSVDVEADGTHPGAFSMSSLGAAVAGYRTKDKGITQIDPDDAIANNLTFYAELKPISDNWDPTAISVGTFENLPGNATPEQTRKYLEQNGQDPKIVMTEFAKWVTETTALFGKNARPVFVAYPLGFDWMWTYWYLVQFSDTGSPFGFSNHEDMKTLFKAKSGNTSHRSTKRAMPKHLLSKRKHTHKAVDDALEQGELLVNLWNWNPNK